MDKMFFIIPPPLKIRRSSNFLLSQFFLLYNLAKNFQTGVSGAFIREIFGVLLKFFDVGIKRQALVGSCIGNLKLLRGVL